MSFRSALLARRYGLPPRTNRVALEEGIDVTMDDGVVLKTDHYTPRAPGPHPTILMRTPYGRQGYGGLAEAYAERGFHVVMQACRGTELSGGTFEPLASERQDGLATLAWLKKQDWFDGRLGLTGPSYLGYCQWAISDAPEVKALSTKVTSAEFRSVTFPSGAFNLSLALGWLQTIEAIRGNGLLFMFRMMSGSIERRTRRAAFTVPLVEGDVVAVGRRVRFWREWFEGMVTDGPRWTDIDHRQRLSAGTPPNHFVSGWYDFMLDQLLADYRRLVEAGQRPYLTIGSWAHISKELQFDAPLETLAWMRAHLLNDRSALREKPVRFHISGANVWREADSFPPGPAEHRTYYLQDEMGLAPALPASAGPQHYIYDPADPTPSVGGALFAFSGFGPVDQAVLEARKDVLVFTSAPLETPLTVIGNAGAIIYMRLRAPHADLFVRLCDVDPRGMSINICDGLRRITPETPVGADGVYRLELSLHATAHCFRRGHRLRIQVSSGAHPRIARNSGTGDPIGTATDLEPNDVEIFHDPQRPSGITVPVYGSE